MFLKVPTTTPPPTEPTTTPDCLPCEESTQLILDYVNTTAQVEYQKELLKTLICDDPEFPFFLRPLCKTQIERHWSDAMQLIVENPEISQMICNNLTTACFWDCSGCQLR